MPDHIVVEGAVYCINPTFKAVLKCLAMLEDCEIPDGYKPEYLKRWFFVENYPVDALAVFHEFVSVERYVYIDPFAEARERAGQDEPKWDSDFDADQIYASFYQAYKIDLFEEDMHWYKFIALLKGLPDGTAFVDRIHLRTKDLSHYKGNDLMKITELKQSVQIPPKYTPEELAEIAEFEHMWG